jgi:chromosomal replication initiator protein
LCGETGAAGEWEAWVERSFARTPVSPDAEAASPADAAWDAIRTGLRRDCGARTFDNWLKPITLGAIDAEAGSVTLNLPSRFMAEWVETHFGERLRLAWKTLLPAVRDVRIAVGTTAHLWSRSSRPPSKPKRPLLRQQAITALNRATGSKRLWSAKPTKSPPPPAARWHRGHAGVNPLFIHAAPERKTHILHSIGPIVPGDAAGR